MKTCWRFSPQFLRLGLFFAIVALAVFAPYIGSSAASYYRHLRGGSASNALSGRAAAHKSGARTAGHRTAEQQIGMALPVSLTAQFPALAALLPAGGQSITVLSGDCSTPQTDFALGEQMCVRVAGAPLGSNGNAARRINFVSRADIVLQTFDVTTDPQDFHFTLPANETTTYTDQDSDPITVDNRGRWKVTLNSVSDNSVYGIEFFSVHAATPYVDLTVYQGGSVEGSQVNAGSVSTFEIYVNNNGPDAAQGVKLTDILPDNTTADSIVENTGLGFVCGSPSAGAITCTQPTPTAGPPPVMPSGATAKFTLIYQVTAGTAADTAISNTVNVSSQFGTDPINASELELADNTSTAGAAVPGSSGTQTCSLNCRENMTVTANATQNTTSGAFVTFSAGSITSGSCGAISADPASGSFFPVGTTIVHVSSETGGGSCSFAITVIDTAAPTIACPTDKTAVADQNGTAIVNPGTPATTPSSNVTVEGVRSDNLALTDPYPVGDTHVTWTVTDSVGRKASCVQKITVTTVCASDTTPPTISAPPDINTSTGPNSTSCGVALDDELGQPTATDDCSVTVTTTGIPAGNLFPIGQTTITYTATDGAGHTATATQKVTVIDDTPPVIFAPADATYTCSSEVPLANASQATGPDIIVNGQAQPGPPSDNCGTPTVTVAPDISSGAGSASSPRIIKRTYTATDGHGNSASATQTITVIDNTPPTISAPTAVVLNTGADATSCGVTVANLDATLGTASASDNCAGATSERSGVPAGNVFPLGDTTITYTATDAAGNTASANQIVTVVDDTPPTITAPSNKTVNADTGSCSATGVMLGTPTTADNCSVASVTNNAPTSFPTGVTTVTWTVTDASGRTATATQTVTVVDNQLPTITAPANVTLYTGLGATSCDKTVANLDATLGTATASDNCPGVTVARSGGNVFPVGETTVTYTATDAHGNTASATQKVTVIDNTLPTVVAPANVTVQLPLNSSATSMTVNYPNPATATDNCAGPITISYSPASGSTFPVGTTTVTVTATDAHGNSASSTFTVTVLYNFTGFFSPIGNLPVLNLVNAGRAIPVKFSLSGNKGLNIFALYSPASGVITCDAGAIPVEVTETVTAGASSLSYTPDQYIYTWKTESSWAGTCRQLVVTLNDGSVHRANFKFR